MKKEKIILLLVLACLCVWLSSCIIYVPHEEYPPAERERYPEREAVRRGPAMDLAYFYDYLSPYGSWVFHASYGYVWIPHRVSHKWRPYTYGRWVWTSYGWTWLSYYPWGWITFHYGRWGWHHRLGWFWVPGTVWAPAWVTWRWGSLYIGWAPLPPDIEFVVGVGFRTFPDELPHHYWVFVEGRYFQYDYLDRYVLPLERNRTVIRFTVAKANLVDRNRQVYNPGVDVDHIRRVTRSDVSRYELEDSSSPDRERVSGRVVRVYRPQLRANEQAKPKSYLSEEEAETKLPELRLRVIETPGRTEPPDRWLKEEHEKELRLLEQSQQKEEEELRRRLEDEKRLASDPASKEKVEKDYSLKAKELKKEHEEEKAKILERHREEEKVVKKKVKKKEEKQLSGSTLREPKEWPQR